MTHEKLLHGAVIESHTHSAPGGLVARSVSDVGLAVPLEQVHVGVVNPFAGTSFEDGVEWAEFPGGQVFGACQERHIPFVVLNRRVQVDDVVVWREMPDHRACAVFVVHASEDQTRHFLPLGQICRTGELKTKLHGLVRLIGHQKAFLIVADGCIEKVLVAFPRNRRLALPRLEVAGREVIEALEPVIIAPLAGKDVELRPVHESVSEGVALAKAAHFIARVQVEHVEIHALGVAVGVVLGVVAMVEHMQRLAIEHDRRILHSLGYGEGQFRQRRPCGIRR